MSFTIGTATFTNGSTAVTAVSLTSGQLSYFASGTAIFVEGELIEAIGSTGADQINLRLSWGGATGSYQFVAFDTIEGLRDAVQSARGFSDQLQIYVDGLSVAPTADSTVVRTTTGAVRAADGVNADEAVVLGQLPDDVADLYARNNILGTVSQSAGVPTGAIIERGSNANGEYVKFSDGTLICIHALTITFSGSQVYLGDGLNWTFPAAFSASPIVSCNRTANSGLATKILRGAPCCDAPSGNQATVRLFATSGDSFVSGDAAAMQSIAIGRWY